MNDWILVLATAVLSSGLTLGGAFLGLRWFVKRQLDGFSDDVADVFEKRLRASFEEAGEALVPEFRGELEAGFRESAEDLLPEFRSQMQEGFQEAAQELLPELRAEVREGFKEGLAQSLSGDIVPHTAVSVAKKGTTLINRFLGKKE